MMDRVVIWNLVVALLLHVGPTYFEEIVNDLERRYSKKGEIRSMR